MATIKKYSAAEIAAYNATHNTPHRKIAAAQAAEAKLLPVTPKHRPDREFAYQTDPYIGETAEQVLERKMLHGENS